MATTLEIVDLASDSQIQLVLTNDSGDQEAAPPAPFPFPLSNAETAEIQWYLTQYLDDPYGPSKERGEAVASGLRNLGRLLFECVFRANPAAQEIAQTAASVGWEHCRLAIVSGRDEFLALPWELLNQEDAGYLATRMAGLVRRLNPGPHESFGGARPTDQFNVLLLTPPASAPLSGAANGAVAVEALAAMESLEAPVGLDRLQPVSLQALTSHLERLPEHYHLVHLDGFDVGAEGLHLDGGPVAVENLARALNTAGVPAALLTCSAAEDGRRAASALAQGGVPQVALLPHRLSGAGRQLFTDAFYHSLANGSGPASAVAAARKALMDNPHRPSASGSAVSWDWLTPVVYQSMEYAPAPVQPEPTDAAIPGMLPSRPEAAPYQLPRGGPYGLIGRHSEVLALERRFEGVPCSYVDRQCRLRQVGVGLGLRLLDAENRQPAGRRVLYLLRRRRRPGEGPA